ncbi:MAG: hypothetical protein HN919_04580 [Verrucomicrobia bacterium]|jgi:hypothetical protein|nr:hypothetical protein [Verrucomicrobiota bacterium]
MDIQTLTKFFMWCTVLNLGFLMITFLFLAFGGDFVYKKHSKWFPMPRETFNVVVYAFLGLYKICFVMFNLIPYVALRIMG